ncbi:MAG: iron ABC transporter permease [Thermoanaerobaculia bacterium]
MKKYSTKFFFLFFLILILVSLIDLFFGPYPVLKGLITKDGYSLQILLYFRLPSLLLAFSSGILLSLSGAIFQSILSNPLADPYILGISGGAASFILISNLFKIPQEFPYSFFAAFFGACFNGFLVYFLSLKKGKLLSNRLLITGIILNGFYSAIILFSMALLDTLELNRFIYWMMGSFSERTLRESILLFAITLFLFIPSILFYRGLDLLSLGNDEASSTGLETDNFILFSYLMGSLLSALSVSFVGIIGFVGLIVPNLVRIFIGSQHRVLLPSSAVLGALFLISSDLITKFKIFQNVPVGALSALLGVPFFIYLMRKNGTP